MIRCIKLRRYEKNTLRAFVDLELSHAGLVLRDCTLHEKNGQKWISFPARSYAGDDGATHWQPLIEFSANANREQFRHQAIAAVDFFLAHFPGAAS